MHNEGVNESLTIRGSKITVGNLKTKAELLKLLSDASKRKPTSEEIEKQRISFIFANLSKDSTVTRDQIEEVLREERGRLAS